MPKIENWSPKDPEKRYRRYHRPVELIWKHDDKNVEVVVLSEDSEVMHKTGAKEYGVLIAEVQGSSFNDLGHKKFDSKNDAKSWARKWMKKNTDL